MPLIIYDIDIDIYLITNKIVNIKLLYKNFFSFFWNVTDLLFIFNYNYAIYILIIP